MTAKQPELVKRTTVRIPSSLKKKLAHGAVNSGKSQQDIITVALQSELNKKEYAAGAKQ